MKKVKVIVKEKTILELNEDASKGDLIDLKELVEVDTSYLDSIIESGKDKVYASKIEEVKKALLAENELEINKLSSEIELLKKQHESELKLNTQNVQKEYLEVISSLKGEISKLQEANEHNIDNIKNEKNEVIRKLESDIEFLKKNHSNQLIIKEQEVAKSYESNISNLKKEIEVLKSTKNSELEALNSKNQAELIKIKNEEQVKYNELEQKYNVITTQYDNQIEKSKLELEVEYNNKISKLKNEYEIEKSKLNSNIENIKTSYEAEKLKALAQQKEKYDEELHSKDDIINNLQRVKSSMNVKQTGEDLEAWCNNTVIDYMQNGLFNCTWNKDNKVIREEGEDKGSKADYIFKVYASNDHKDNELLTSVCMDMKDENPESVNKKTNSDYYKQLDKNREKKSCKYAVLVSNLEMDKPNVLPMYRVREYNDMYVVRPAYLMVFLNMIASLTTRFADLVLSKEVEMIQLKTKLELINQFDDIKRTYLDKPLESLEKSVEAISKSSESIKSACRNIDDQCDKINRSYISQINEKINKFDLKLSRGIINNIEE